MVKKIIYINELLFSSEKEGNPAFCNNMGEPGGHYAKWNKPDRETNTAWCSWYYVESLENGGGHQNDRNRE